MSSPIGSLLTAEVLKALKQSFPLHPPRLTQSDREIWMEAGRQHLIEYLQYEFDEANTTILAE